MQLTKLFLAPRSDVFDAFIDPQKLKQWFFTEGHSLRVSLYEPKVGGKFEFVFSGPNGESVYSGTISELVPNESLGLIDGSKHWTHISFRDHEKDTEVVVRQEGFKNNKEAFRCEQDWVDSLFKLSNVLTFKGKLPPQGSQEHALNQ